MENEAIIDLITDKVKEIYENKHKEAQEKNIDEVLTNIERHLILNVVNEKWMDHIDAISQLKDGIGLRAYGQTNPVEAYKIESFEMFEDLVDTIQEESTKAVFSVRPKTNEDSNTVIKENTVNIRNISTNEGGSSETKRQPVKAEKKVGRNEPCPCGSGKKYKQCHGK